MDHGLKRLSVLDIGPVRDGQSASDVFASMTALAQHADVLGYHRYWCAEHHNVAGVAASQTAVLSAVIAGATPRIRVGGCVLLPHYTPMLAAEQFAMLEACFPHRVDVGFGRSSGADWVASALLRGPRRNAEAEDAHPAAIAETIALLRPDGLQVDTGSGVRQVRAAPAITTTPEIWVLGTSLYSARLAAAAGLPYAFGYHITGEGVAEALDHYRAQFKPSPLCAEPRVLLSAIVVAGPTKAEAERLAKSQLVLMSMFRSGEAVSSQMLVETADDFAIPERYSDLIAMFRKTWIIDEPDGVLEQAARLCSSLGVEEFMVNPVAAGFAGDDPRRAPNRELTLDALAPLIPPTT